MSPKESPRRTDFWLDAQARDEERPQEGRDELDRSMRQKGNRVATKKVLPTPLR